MKFDGHEVKSSYHLKILGVTIDNPIPWSAKVQLYKSNILPHLTYYDIV